ncbi:MAG: phosphodiester glycosidase family protein [Candidatus Sericytochromatia bacterium]|nr:phosphodiester glycosidase family protein [Candidatus Sericytochromatia bacterium]
MEAPAEPAAEWRIHAERVELHLPVPAYCEFEAWATDEAWTLRVRSEQTPCGLVGFTDPVLGTASVEPLTTGGFTLRLPWRHWCPVEVGPDDRGGLRVLVRKVYEVTTVRELAPGVAYEQRRKADADGPLVAHVLRLDPRVPGLEVQPVIARDGFAARETVSSMARRRGAVAAINGSYFSPRTGEPLGLLMVNGELVSAPLFHRSAVALGGLRPKIGATALGFRLALPTGETYDLDGLNQPRGLNRLVLYTSRYGPRTATAAGGREWVLDRQGVVLASGEADSPIPADGRVLSAHGQAADWLAKRLKPGTRVKLTMPLAEQWPEARHVVGGGPLLLERGNVRITAEREQFRPDVALGRAPRTALGITADGSLLLVAVDGRQPRHSLGLTLEGLAQLLRSLGAAEALNLDGGGSTVMTVGDTPVSRPSDGTERPVNNALLVVVRGEGMAGTPAWRP